MVRIAFMCCVLMLAVPAKAYELGDNPAFCAGFLSSQSDRFAAMMRTHEVAITDAFNRQGPKDSTDSRGFAEWVHVGVQAAADTADPGYENTFVRCRSLIESIAQK